MKKQHGLSLVEVMVAMVIIAVGVIAAAGLQTTALKNTTKAQTVNEVTKIAENELSLQRQMDGSGDQCETQISSEYTCSVTVIPCNVQSGAISCSSSIATPKAYQISVNVTGPQQNSVSLSTIVADTLYAGRVASNP